MWVTSKPARCDVVSKLPSLFGVSGLGRSRGGGIGTHKAGSWQGKPQAAPPGRSFRASPWHLTMPWPCTQHGQQAHTHLETPAPFRGVGNDRPHLTIEETESLTCPGSQSWCVAE